MRLYFSGMGGAQKIILDFVMQNLPMHRALASYAMKGQLDKLIDYGFESIFLDSGAYSVMNSGVTIDIDSYIDFAKDYQDRVDIVATLDVIDDPEGSLKNYRYIAKKDLDVWPAWHFGETHSLLAEYLRDTDHICVGGLAGKGVAPKAIRRNLQELYSLHPDIKVHVFGVNAFEAVMGVPIYSTDALTWRSGSRFGDAFIKGRRYKVGRKYQTSAMSKEAIRILQGEGLDLTDPEFDWNLLDCHNIKALYQILEIRHEATSFNDVPKPTFLF